MRLVAPPLSVDILVATEEKQGGSVETAVAPVRQVESKVVIDEDACSVGAFVLGVSLVLAVTVVKQLYIHFIQPLPGLITNYQPA